VDGEDGAASGRRVEKTKSFLTGVSRAALAPPAAG
jgi:hypothetical protein